MTAVKSFMYDMFYNVIKKKTLFFRAFLGSQQNWMGEISHILSPYPIPSPVAQPRPTIKILHQSNLYWYIIIIQSL